MKRFAYLGPPGTFSHKAAKVWVAKNYPGADLVPLRTIPEVLRAIAQNVVDQGILPVENSIEGTVNLTLDGFARYPLFVQGEIILEIEHCLLGKERKIKAFKAVYSHPQALAQCQEFLTQFLPEAELIPVASTAEAARLVAQEKAEAAAIASAFAAACYQLEVIRSGIQAYPNNKTRFWAVASENTTPVTGRDKTSLVFALPENRPGGLYAILREFAQEEIDLTKIESRPTKKELGSYLFYLDCCGHHQEEKLQRVLGRLKAKTAFLRILGSYPQFEEES